MAARSRYFYKMLLFTLLPVSILPFLKYFPKCWGPNTQSTRKISSSQLLRELLLRGDASLPAAGHLPIQRQRNIRMRDRWPLMLLPSIGCSTGARNVNIVSLTPQKWASRAGGCL